MKKLHSARSFAAGVLVTLLVVALVPAAVAATASRDITVYPGISIYIDDQKIDPKDANGNPVEVFNYNGTVYLPVRAVSEALGQPVQWEGTTRSVYVGKHSGSKPAVWLSQMDYFSGTSNSDFRTAASEKDNAGDTHYNCITRTFDRTYILNGQYSRISGILYQTYEDRSRYTGHSGSNNFLEIYGDGELLYSRRFERETGIDPIPFNVDLTGVLKLRVSFKSYSDFPYGYPLLSLGEVGLWT